MAQSLFDDYQELRRALGFDDRLTHSECVTNARMIWQTLQEQDKAICTMNRVLRDMQDLTNAECGNTTKINHRKVN